MLSRHLRHHPGMWIAFAGLLALAIAGCGPRQTADTAPRVLRVGYFPNLTHAQALIGLADGSFARALEGQAEIKPFVMNAGPSAIEALFAGELDLTYIGPNPAVNGYVKSSGTALRIVAGAASGGAAFVVREAAGIQRVEDLAGRRIATPQLGNTQDVALRHYVLQHGLAAQEQGGRVLVTPMQNPDILTAFLRKEIDGAWVPEPWAARLVHEAGGRIWLDERERWPNGRFATAIVIVSTKALQEHPAWIEQWLRAHVQVTRWIAAHPEDAKRIANEELAKLAGKPVAPKVLDDAWGRLSFVYEPLGASIRASADHAFALGFLGKQKPDLTDLVNVMPLNAALRGLGLPEVAAD